MKAKRIAVLLVSLVLLTAAIGQPEEKAQPVSGTRTASCLVKVTADPEVLPLSLRTIASLLRSSGVGGKAAADVLGLPAVQEYRLFTIEPLIGEPEQPRTRRPSTKRRSDFEEDFDEYEEFEAMTRQAPKFARGRPETATRPGTPTVDGQTLLFRLIVEFDEDVKPAAEEFMWAIIENLRRSLHRAFDEYKSMLESEQLIPALDHTQEAERDFQDCRDNLRMSIGRARSRDVILEDVRGFRRQLQALKMEAASTVAVIGAIAKQVGEIEHTVKKQIEEDHILNELLRVLVLREKAMERVQALAEQGEASPSDVEEAMARCLQARMQLAQRQEQITKSAGGDRINSLRAESAQNYAAYVQAKARIDYLEAQIAESVEPLEQTLLTEPLLMKYELARQSFEEAIALRDQMRRRIVLLLHRPTVLSLGAR